MIKIIINSSSHYPVDKKRIRRKVEKTLKNHGMVDEVELGIFIVGDRKMISLNKRFMKRGETTDVLSFPLIGGDGKWEFIDFPEENEKLYLGDIFISYPQARKQAGEYGLLLDEEIDKLVEHGVFHLLGIHHSK